RARLTRSTASPRTTAIETAGSILRAVFIGPRSTPLRQVFVDRQHGQALAVAQRRFDRHFQHRSIRETQSIMCGRFALTVTPDQTAAFLGLAELEEFGPLQHRADAAGPDGDRRRAAGAGLQFAGPPADAGAL